MGTTLDLDDVAATSENAKQELASLRETVAVLKERLKAAEETICSTERERDCVTAEDWKRKAMHYEYQWRSCSEFANRRIGELTHNAPHEGPGAASSRTVPLDAVVGGQKSALTGRQ